MAKYKYAQFLNKSDSQAYDNLFSPGASCPNSGIFRCTGCGKEAACNKGDSLPPQNHHQHLESLGAIKWQLIVFAE